MSTTDIELVEQLPVSKWQQTIVKLNVGGVRYETSLRTLLRYSDSMFGIWFANWKKENQEAYFIDFDGENFKFVLEFLRYGESAILPKDEQTLQRLHMASDYFQLPRLQLHADSLITNKRGLRGVELTHGETVKFSDFGIPNCVDSFAQLSFSWMNTSRCFMLDAKGNRIHYYILGLMTLLTSCKSVSCSVCCPDCGKNWPSYTRSDPKPSLQDEFARHREVFQSQMQDVVLTIISANLPDVDCVIVLDKKLKDNKQYYYHVAKCFIERSESNA